MEQRDHLTLSQEESASTQSGLLMLLLGLLLLAATAFMFVSLRPDIGIGIAILTLMVFSGFYNIQPNQAVAIMLFGNYKGTDRRTGLRWVPPWLGRTKISVRVHNAVSPTIKVNDKRGNPIEIAAVVVWRVKDTAQALFDVENYKSFVDVQIESAVRAVAARYPYDDIEHKEITLRADADHICEELRAEIQQRVLPAGVAVDETRLAHLAYAPEIAGAMLRRQQAEAVIAARQLLVEGAVTMVETALDMLAAKGVVELDAERRAVMVSNLMVVLCGEREAQPVVNTGTLYS